MSYNVTRATPHGIVWPKAWKQPRKRWCASFRVGWRLIDENHFKTKRAAILWLEQMEVKHACLFRS